MTSLLATHIWPDTSLVAPDGHLVIGGCDSVALAAFYGTPLYVLDDATIRSTMRRYRVAFAQAYPHTTRIHYASKALFNTAIAQIVRQEQLSLDVVSGGELFVARRVDFPLQAVHMHGNAKTRAELERALAWNIGAIVVDTLDELELLATLSANRPKAQPILLRIAPGIDAHTHTHIATGGSDSKFGLPLDALAAAASRIQASPGLELIGLHAHIGSQVTDFEPLKQNVRVLLECAARLRDAHGMHVKEISPGGGLGVPYLPHDPVPAIDAYAQALATAMIDGCAHFGLPPLDLTIEPGRSIIARAGVALYNVTATKVIQPVPYIHIDGGMADNIRPALYGASYTALLANRANEPDIAQVHIAGRYCESGDVMLRDITLPAPKVGDTLAVAVSGAYTLSMASTYNLVPRPAVVLVNNGKDHLIQRRETEEDLVARDIALI